MLLPYFLSFVQSLIQLTPGRWENLDSNPALDLEIFTLSYRNPHRGSMLVQG